MSGSDDEIIIRGKRFVNKAVALASAPVPGTAGRVKRWHVVALVVLVLILL